MAKKLIWMTIVVAILITITAVAGNNAALHQNGPIKLGVIAGTTGQYAPAGEGYLKGFKLAMAQWNASSTPKFFAIIEDDGFDAVKGLAAYKKLESVDNVDAFAIVSSFTIDAAYDLVHTDKKPVALGFEQSKPAEDDNIFQVLPAAKPIQFALAGKLKSLGYKAPVAAVSNTTSVYQNFYDGFNAGWGSEVKKFEIGSDIGGIKSQALAIVAAKPDVVALFMAPKDGAQLVKEIMRITTPADRPYFAFDQDVQSGATDYQTILGSDISKLDGSIVSMSSNDLTPAFKQAYTAVYNEAPPFGSDMGYNSFMLLATSYSSDPAAWVVNMKKARFMGADGDVYFDDVGLRAPNIFFGKLQGGKVI